MNQVVVPEEWPGGPSHLPAAKYDQVRLCYIRCRYRIEARGRRWLRGVSTCGRYHDRILINEASAAWQPGDELLVHARHDEGVVIVGQRAYRTVRLLPISPDLYAGLPAKICFDL